MADAYRCRVCRRLSGDLDSFDAKMRCWDCADAPDHDGLVGRQDDEDKPETRTTSAGPLPAYDPLVQEFREKYGRTAQEELYPECDEINGGR